MRRFTFHDLMLFRKCPRAFYLEKDRPASEDERKLLPLAAAMALRPPENAQAFFRHAAEIHRGHFSAKVDLVVSSAEGLELLIDTNAFVMREGFVQEAAYTVQLLSANGLGIRKITALTIRQDYTRQEEICWQELYAEQDITKRVQKAVPFIRALMQKLAKLAKEPEAPEQELEEHCLKPRECACWAECTKELPRPNVFELVGMSNKRKFTLYRKGIVDFAQCLEQAKIAKPQKFQILHALENRQPYVDKVYIRNFLASLWYPMVFLDFESYQPYIPPFTGLQPFAQCAFLYSLHIVESEGAEPVHRELFVPHGTDPRRLIAEGLCADIPENACMLVYSSGLEKAVLKGLAQRFPDLEKRLLQMHQNIHDMLGIFSDRHYYDARMQGSCSLKHVLPAFGGDLRYTDLEGVQNGEEAVHVYEKLPLLSQEERVAAEKALCAYCAVDTLALVRIIETLKSI